MNKPASSEDLETSIQNVLNGDLSAFTYIVETYEADTRAVVAAMIPDRNMVADTTQQVFIIAYKRLSTYQPDTNFKAWLRTIARNTAQNERRRWYSRRDMEQRYQTDVEKRIEDDIDKVVEALPDDILEALRSCMDNLGGKTRALMDGFYFQEHAIKELAKAFELTTNAVKVTLHRARHAMGKCLRRKGGPDA